VIQVERVTNEPQHEPVDPYRSARDLPRFVEMQQQLAGFKTLTRFVARDQRETIKKLERQMEELVDAVDQFYELLGPRNLDPPRPAQLRGRRAATPSFATGSPR
jgi:hypothetical protein